MRINLTTRSRAFAGRAERRDYTDRILRLSLPLLALAAAFTQAPGAIAGTVQTGCHKVDELRATMFPQMDVVAYDFTGADAGKLKVAMDAMTAASTPDATLVRVVLLPNRDEAFAFQFGTDGCRSTLLALDWAEMAHMFQNAGVYAPFGATFYQWSNLSF